MGLKPQFKAYEYNEVACGESYCSPTCVYLWSWLAYSESRSHMTSTSESPATGVHYFNEMEANGGSWTVA